MLFIYLYLFIILLIYEFIKLIVYPELISNNIIVILLYFYNNFIFILSGNSFFLNITFEKE